MKDLPSHIEAGLEAKKYAEYMNVDSENHNGFHEIDFLNGTIWFREQVENLLDCKWIKYDFNILESRPPKYGKYFVHRKDGKVHLETWNGSGFAYNNNVITQNLIIFIYEYE